MSTSLFKRIVGAVGFVMVLSMAVTFTFGNNNSSALSGSEFKAGRIIDDAYFYNGTTMSAAEIQDFLNAKVPTCDTNGSQGPYYDKYGKRWDTRADYGRAHSSPPPYTCLKGYKQDTGYKAGQSGLCSAIEAKSGRTAAQIIDDVARACHISQKVILVMLQKEQGLVTDDWPWPIQYRGAMGYGCPDTAACDSEYYGFFNQVYNAALQFQRYKADPNNWNHVPFMTNQVLYQANAPDCGSRATYIENYATAGLYNYTPYTPNQAALDNLYGEGNGCSAYGNRNFWRYYNDWFGSPTAPPYAWEPVSQELFSDVARTKPLNVDSYAPNATYYLRVTVKNIGSQTWSNSGSNPVNMATTHDKGRTSIFCDSSWLICSRPATLKEASVAPGAYGTFEFSIKAPSYYGFYKEYYSLVVEGKTWMNDLGLHYYLPVREPIPSWQPVSQEMHTDAERTKPLSADALAPTTTYYLRLKAVNRGNTTWSNGVDSPVNLATSHPRDRNSPFCDTSWHACNRPAKLKEASVAPGETGTFEFSVKTPSSYGAYKEYYSLVADGKMWMNDIGLHWQMPVKEPTYAWKYGGQTIYTDSTKTTVANSSTTSNDSRLFLSLQAINTGNTTWKNTGSNPVNLGTDNLRDRTSRFCDSSTWVSCNRAAKLSQASVAPGETGTFEFWVRAPYALNGATFSEHFTPVAEGKAWLNDQGMYQSFKMSSSEYVWQYGSQSAHIDSSRTITANLGAAAPNTTYYLTLKAKNISGRNWSNTGSNPVNLGTSSPNDRTSSFCDSSWLTLTCNRPARLKEASVAPGEIGTFEFSIRTPSATGTYTEYFLPVIEGASWLNDLGQNWSITIQ